MGPGNFLVSSPARIPYSYHQHPRSPLLTCQSLHFGNGDESWSGIHSAAGIAGGDPGQRWLTFLANHREMIAALDFFTVPRVTFRLLLLLLCHRTRTQEDPALQRNPTPDCGVGRPATAGSLSRGWPAASRHSGSGCKVRCRRARFPERNRLAAQADQHSIALAEWNSGTLGGRMSEGVTRPCDCAERSASAAPGPRLRFLLSRGPHSRQSWQGHAESPALRKEAVFESDPGFQCAIGWSSSSLLLEAGSVECLSLA
jgi:hypothetical protein